MSLVGKLIDGIVDVDSSDDVEEDVEDAEDGGRRSWHQHLRVDMTKQHLKNKCVNLCVNPRKASKLI